MKITAYYFRGFVVREFLFALRPTNSPTLWYQPGVSNSIQFWHFLALASHSTSSRTQSYKTTCTWDASYKPKATTLWLFFPSSHSIILTFENLLERLTELRKTVDLHLLVFQKEYSSGAATWIKCIGQVWGREVQACMPFSRHATRSPGTEMCSPTRKLSRSHCQAFVYFSCQPLSSPQLRRQQTKHLIFLRPSPILRPSRDRTLSHLTYISSITKIK